MVAPVILQVRIWASTTWSGSTEMQFSSILERAISKTFKLTTNHRGNSPDYIYEVENHCQKWPTKFD